MPVALTEAEIAALALENATGNPIERLAMMLHEAGRLVHGKGLPSGARAGARYPEYAELKGESREALRVTARFLIERGINLPKDWWL